MTSDGPCPPAGAVSGAGGSDARAGDPAEPASFEDAVRLLRESRARELALEGRIADLRLAQQDLSAFFDTVDDLHFVLDEQGVMLEVNQAVCRRLGYAREELLGRSVLDVHPPDRREEAGRIVAAMLVGEAAFCPVPVVTRDGAEIPVETRVARGVWRGGPALFGVTKDVSALKLSEEKFARAFHSAPTLTAISTIADGRYLDINEVFLTTLGFDRDEVVGCTSAELEILVDPGDRDRVLRVVREQGSARDVEVSFRCKDGAVVLGLLSADPIDVGGEPCVLTTALGITERRAAEEEAARQARLQEILTDLAATYIDLPLDAVETAIDRSLQELGEFVHADRVYIFEYDMAGQTTSNTFEWCGDGIEPAIDGLQQIPFAGLHDWVETHLRGDHLYVPDVGSLPEGTVREILEPQGIKSLLAVPMMSGRSCLGFVGFDSVHHHHEYTEGELRLLSVFGGMLAGVHQRRQADEALHSAAERLALATQAGGVGVWEWDLATDDLIWDEQMLQLYGVGRTDFGGAYTAWQAGLHPDDRERAQSEIQAAVRGEGDFDTEFRIVRPDGTLRTVRAMARVRRAASGEATHVIGTNWDITESRRMEQSLRLRESYLTAIIESHPGMVWLKDTESRFLAVNSAFAQSCGQGTPQNVVGKTDFDVWPADLAEAYRSDDVRVLAAGRPYSVEEPIADKGERRWFETFKTPVADDGGIVLGTTGYAWDITERKRAEEELRDVNRQLREAVARANELAVEARAATTAKGRFLAHMSHEIRTPLNAIIGFAHLMETDPELTVGQKDRVGIITRSGEHLLALLSDILELSKVDSGRQRLEEVTFDLHRLLEDLVLVFRVRAEASGLAFTYEVAAGVPRCARADQAKLRQILTNLLANAVRLTEAGSVCLRVSAADDGAGRLLLTAAVEDTGPGIAADEMDELFAPFEQTRSGRAHGSGTGLGLAISRQFAWLMGGDLAVDSVSGAGSVFRLQVPVQPREGEQCTGDAPSRGAVRLEAGQAQCHVVVVDADDDGRALLVELLRGAGFEVAAVTESLDARVAVEMRRPRLVIVADSLPEMEGFEVVRAIRATQAGAATRIIVLAAGATDASRDAALLAGADVFMAKPFRAAELFEWVRSLTGVRYEPAAAPERPAQSDGPGLTRDMVACLRPELRRALREAAVRARHGHLLELADEVARSDPEAGARLSELLVVFDYAAVLQALGGEGGSDADG